MCSQRMLTVSKKLNIIRKGVWAIMSLSDVKSKLSLKGPVGFLLIQIFKGEMHNAFTDYLDGFTISYNNKNSIIQ